MHCFLPPRLLARRCVIMTTMSSVRHIAARAAPRVGLHAAAQDVLRRHDSSDTLPPLLPPSKDEHEFVQLMVTRAEYRAWRRRDLHASPVPRASKLEGTEDLLRWLVDHGEGDPAPQQAPREVPQAPATRLADEFELHEVLGVGGFGVVRAATSKLDQGRYAIKAVQLLTPLEREAALGEVRTMVALPPPPGRTDRERAAHRASAPK